ncbi:MAG: MFS transporter [Bdellovibrionales bacterium]
MHRNIRLLYLHNLLTDFRFQAPFVLIYFEQVTGSYTAATLILATETLMAALLDIPTGIFSDRFSRRATLACGSASYALSLTCYAFGSHFAVFILGATLFGLSLALFSGNNNAMLYETLKAEGKEKRFHHYQGRASSMFQIGLGVSAFLAGFIAPFGLRIVFMLGIIPQILAVIVSLLMKEPRTHIEVEEKSLAHFMSALRTVWRNPRLRLLTVAQSISYGFGEASFMFNTAFVNMVWPTWAVAAYRMLAHIFAFAGYWFSGKILDRIKPAFALAAASAYGLVSGLAAVFMANIVSPLIFVTGSGFFGAYMVARDKIMQEEFNDRQRATMSSVITFGGSLVSGAAALILGLIADHYGVIAALASGILLSGTALPVFVRMFRRYF